jgi:hypothetical protein
MKTKYIYILLIVSVFLTLNSCEKNLDIPQQGVTSVNAFYVTDNDAQEAVAAVYSSWRSMSYNEFFIKNLLTDDINGGGGSRGDNTQIEQLNEFTFGPSNTMISGAFSAYYSLIYLSNMAINNFKPDSEVKIRVIAEAKVARAWAYFNLVTLWGPVPFVLRELAPSEYQQPNGDPVKIWEQIESDLTSAISGNALPEKKDAADKTIGARLTKQAAIAFLGKAQLFEGKNAEAAATLKQITASGKYALYEDYGNILREAADFCSESIFEMNSLNDGNNAFNQGTTIFGQMIGWRSDKLFMFGFYIGAHDMYPNGWGFASPTQNLYHAFVDMEGTDGYRLNNTIKTYNQVTAMGITLNPATSLYGNEGYFDWKQRFIGKEVVTNSYGYSISANFRVMRYAEVLLMAAEACLQSGDAAGALDFINQIRTRAKLTPLTQITLDDIKKEKRLELCFEQTRYQDLIRWGDAPAVLGNQGKNIPSFYGLNTDGTFNVQTNYTNSTFGFKSGKHELLPFPEHEMSVNKNLTQNTGW